MAGRRAKSHPKIANQLGGSRTDPSSNPREPHKLSFCGEHPDASYEPGYPPFGDGQTCSGASTQPNSLLLDEFSRNLAEREEFEPSVRDFLQQHPRVQLHFTPMYSSWLTKSSSGSPRSNVRSLPAASSPLYLTWLANSVVTSTPTLPTLARSSGNTPTLLGAYVLTNSSRQATSRVQGLSFGSYCAPLCAPDLAARQNQISSILYPFGFGEVTFRAFRFSGFG